MRLLSVFATTAPTFGVNTAKFALMNGDGRNVSKTINIPADGEYKLMVMSIEYNNRYQKRLEFISGKIYV